MKGWNDEAELIRRCKHELPYNHSSFEVLFDRYKNLVYTLCYRLAGTQMEAEDLSQEVFTKVFLKLEHFEERSKFSTWLYRIAHNHCLDYILTRNKEAERLREFGEEHKRLSPGYDRPGFSERSQDALNRISADERGILVMKYVLGLDLKEIGAALGITTGAVKMRLMRAKKEFRLIYEEGNATEQSSPYRRYSK